MPFEIVRNDITCVKADAIVNTANPCPVIGAGTDSAIHKAAGPQLIEARKQIGNISPGHAAATPAFHLDANYVFHTVSPLWQGGNHDEISLLRQAYDAALNLAVEKKCVSVAFPLMAAGSYHFPREQALAVAIQAFTDFLMNHDLDIYLVVLNQKAFSLAGGLFSGLKSYIDEDRAEEQIKREHQNPRLRRYYEDVEFCQSDAATLSVPRISAKTAVSPMPNAMETILAQPQESFVDTLCHLIDQRGLKNSDVYRRADMSRQQFSQIIKKRTHPPERTAAIQLAIGLKLSLEETQALLGKAGYALTPSIESDRTVIEHISAKVHNMVLLNMALFAQGLSQMSRGISA